MRIRVQSTGEQRDAPELMDLTERLDPSLLRRAAREARSTFASANSFWLDIATHLDGVATEWERLAARSWKALRYPRAWDEHTADWCAAILETIIRQDIRFRRIATGVGCEKCLGRGIRNGLCDCVVRKIADMEQRIALLGRPVIKRHFKPGRGAQ